MRGSGTARRRSSSSSGFSQRISRAQHGIAQISSEPSVWPARMARRRCGIRSSPPTPSRTFPSRTKRSMPRVYSRREDQGRSALWQRIASPRARSGWRRTAADAEKERESEPELFRNGPWTMERKYEMRSRRRWSLCEHRQERLREHPGGAHPNSSTSTRSCGIKSAGKRISIRPFFTETADNGPTMKAMRQGVVISLRAEKKQRGAGRQRYRVPSKPSSQSFSRSARSRWRHRPRKARVPA